MHRWLPNLVTASRGACGPVVAWLLVAHGANVAAFVVFVLAMLTDLVDGWLAKKLDAHSELGLVLDPLADKLLLDTTWLALWWIGWAPGWLAGTLVARDGAVLLGSGIARAQGRRWRATLLGRVAVSFEGIAVPVLLVHHRWVDVHWYTVGVLLGILTLALSAASVVEYVLTGPERARGIDSPPERSA